MTTDNKTLLYEKNHFIIVNDIEHFAFYYFDYGERSKEINMTFPHFHSHYEIHILMHPQACHFIEGIPYTIRDNDFVLLRPSVLHRSEYLDGPPSKRLVIGFLYPQNFFVAKEAYKALLTPFYEKVPIYRFPLEHRQELNRILNQIYRLSTQDEPEELYNMMIHTTFIQFLYLLKKLAPYNTYTNEKIEDDTAKKMFTVANYIHCHYQDELSLESIAEHFFISPSYLSHQFKNVTGYTLIHYIHLTRIRNIQFLLINTDEKISKISDRCGFTSFSQFNRIFNKFSGMSPSDYRKTFHHTVNYINPAQL